MNTQAYTEALERSLGRVVAQARGELDLLKAQTDATVAAANAKVAEAAARLDSLEARICERLTAVANGVDGRDGVDGKDGLPGEMGKAGADGRDGLQGEPGPKGEPGEPGKDGEPGPKGEKGDPGEKGDAGPKGERGAVGIDDILTEFEDDGHTLLIKFVYGDTAEVHEIPLPPGPKGDPGERGLDGINGKDGEPGPRGEPGERGLEGAPGKLPIAKAWEDTVHYQSDVVTHEGATWQALKDTGRAPGSADWICIAERGADGRDARGMVIRGTWTAENEYEALDVVALNGAAFVAKIDNPGPCPGEGWQLMSAQGKRGQTGDRGEKGERGERGLAGASMVRADLDDETGLLTFHLSDGTGVHCDLAPLAERIIRLARS